MTQTSYVNPNGLPADGQVTSARDLAILARAVIRDLPEYEYFMHIPAIRFGRRVTNNFNKLMGRYPGADGFKTGFICASGYNLVASATRNGKRLIAVVLGSNSGQARAVKAAQLLERGFANNGLAWLRPSLGTVESLAPIDASPPNLRDEMCNGKRKRPATDEDADVSPPRWRVRAARAPWLSLPRACRRRWPTFGTAAGARGRRAHPRLHRPEEDRLCPDRGGCAMPKSRRARRRGKKSQVAAKKPAAAARRPTEEASSRTEARRLVRPATPGPAPRPRSRPLGEAEGCRQAGGRSGEHSPRQKPAQPRAAAEPKTEASRPAKSRRRRRFFIRLFARYTALNYS